MKRTNTLTPNTLSLRELERRGYVAALVESGISGTRFKRDLYGFVDVIGVGHGETVAVQATSDHNVPARIRKIAESAAVDAVREAGWRILVHGWRDDELVREVDVS